MVDLPAEITDDLRVMKDIQRRYQQEVDRATGSDDIFGDDWLEGLDPLERARFKALALASLERVIVNKQKVYDRAIRVLEASAKLREGEPNREEELTDLYIEAIGEALAHHPELRMRIVDAFVAIRDRLGDSEAAAEVQPGRLLSQLRP